MDFTCPFSSRHYFASFARDRSKHIHRVREIDCVCLTRNATQKRYHHRFDNIHHHPRPFPSPRATMFHSRHSFRQPSTIVSRWTGINIVNTDWLDNSRTWLTLLDTTKLNEWIKQHYPSDQFCLSFKDIAWSARSIWKDALLFWLLSWIFRQKKSRYLDWLAGGSSESETLSPPTISMDGCSALARRGDTDRLDPLRETILSTPFVLLLRNVDRKSVPND